MPTRALSVRARLTLWNTLAMGLLLAVFAVAIYLFVRESLHAQLDKRLEDSLAVISTTATDYREDYSEIERHSLVLAYRVMQGETPVFESRVWITDFLERSGNPPESGRWVFVSPRGGIFHLKQERIVLGDRELTITAAEQADQTVRALNRLAWTLAGGFPIGLLLSLWGGYFLAGRSLSPLQQITHRARHISADNLSERLTVPNPHDELGQLTAVLNDAFSRLEESFTRLKRFTQNAAHELRTPLAVLRSVGEVGLQEQRDAKGYRDVIGSMLEEVDRLGRLVDGLLTLAHAESGRFSINLRSENLTETCRDVVEVLRVLAEDKNQTLTFEARGDYRANVDADTLRLALINLIANAIRFTPNGGTICVSVYQRDNGEVNVEITDTGPGIAREHHTRIFERFYRVEHSRAKHTGGSGLGLAIAHWAVESNSGRIELESELGQGSCFRIILPAT